MTGGTLTVNRLVLGAAALGLLLIGAVGASLWFIRGAGPAPAPMSSHMPADGAASDTSGPARAPDDMAISLSPELMARASIVVAPVGGDVQASPIRVPGNVEPNAYRQVVVTPLVPGRLTRVDVELGQVVRRGQTLACVYSPDLAEAQAKVRAARASLDAHERELERTEKLVRIGAASREGLERVHAEHAAQVAAVTRTTRMRIEIADERGQLRLGTYVDVALESSSRTGTARENTVSVGVRVRHGHVAGDGRRSLRSRGLTVSRIHTSGDMSTNMQGRGVRRSRNGRGDTGSVVTPQSLRRAQGTDDIAGRVTSRPLDESISWSGISCARGAIGLEAGVVIP